MNLDIGSAPKTTAVLTERIKQCITGFDKKNFKWRSLPLSSRMAMGVELEDMEVENLKNDNFIVMDVEDFQHWHDEQNESIERLILAD